VTQEALGSEAVRTAIAFSSRIRIAHSNRRQALPAMTAGCGVSTDFQSLSGAAREKGGRRFVGLITPESQ